MKFREFGSAVSRRVVVMAVVAVLAAGSVGVAQDTQAPAQQPAQDAQAPAQEPAQGQAAQPDNFAFKSEAGLIQWQVKADRMADFESAWSAIRTKLVASVKPELKVLGDTMRMYKVALDPVPVPGQGNIATYYFVIDPVTPGSSYDPSKILYDHGDLFPREEADQLFNKLAESLAGIGPQPLTRMQ